MITVGIVYHQHAAAPPFESDGSITVLSHVNAGVNTPWRGFGENHNMLMDVAKDSDWYVAVNPDVIATPKDISRLILFAEANDYMIVGPAISAPWGMINFQALQLPTPMTWFDQALRGSSSTKEQRSTSDAAWITGACMAIRLTDVNIRFDTKYFMYFEDVDLCFRASRSGHRIGFCHDVVVTHASGWSTKDPLRWRRGVEFARSAMHFADTTGSSRTLMRLSGLLRFGSRIPLPQRTESEAVAARCISRGLLSPRAPGLAELAHHSNKISSFCV